MRDKTPIPQMGAFAILIDRPAERSASGETGKK